MAEQKQVNQNNDWRGIARNYSTLSPETEKLLTKYLKMQIGRMYWGAFVKLIIIGFVVGSTIFSMTTLAPFLQKQMKVFESMQPLLNNVSSVALPTSNTSATTININDVLEQMSDEQKEDLIEMLEEN